MGFPTQVKWVWAAMNPISYSATRALLCAPTHNSAYVVSPVM